MPSRARAGPLALVALLLPPSCVGWVLTEPAQRWPYPSGSLDSTGLGKGLAWTEDYLFCDTMMRQFESETVTYFGTLFFTFVTCDEITDTLVRAFSVWAANHRKLSFYRVADRCPVNETHSAADCSYAEIVFQTGPTPTEVPLLVNLTAVEAEPRSTAAETLGGVRSTQHGTVVFSDTDCYYLDGEPLPAVTAVSPDPRAPTPALLPPSAQSLDPRAPVPLPVTTTRRLPRRAWQTRCAKASTSSRRTTSTRSSAASRARSASCWPSCTCPRSSGCST